MPCLARPDAAVLAHPAAARGATSGRPVRLAGVSALYVVTVLERSGRRVRLRLRNSLASSHNEAECSPGFALGVLRDAARDCPLADALGEDMAEDMDVLDQRASEFIANATLEDRRNQNVPATDAGAWATRLERAGEQSEDKYCERIHNYTVLIEATDPRYIAHLERGKVFETVAYDWQAYIAS